MINRILAIVLALMPLISKAQNAIGDWELFPAYQGVSAYNNNMFSEAFTGYRLLDTPDHVYYMSAGLVFDYDKAAQENNVYTKRTKLSDNTVTGLWYNYDLKYLFIAYDNGNIDLLYDDGTIVNMPDIKDAILTTTKTINDVAFNSGRIYVATSFGIVVFDSVGHYVVDSGIYNINISTIAVVNGNLVALSERALKFLPVDSRINQWSNFKQFSNFNVWGNCIRPLSGDAAVFRSYNTSDYQLRTLNFNFEAGTISSMPWINESAVDYITPMSGNRYSCVSGGKLWTISPDGTTTSVDVPSVIGSQVVAMCDSPAALWTANDNGIAQFDITTSTPTVKNDYMAISTIHVREASRLRYAPSGRLYINTMHTSTTWDKGQWQYNYLDIYDGTKFENVACHNLTYYNSNNPSNYYPAAWDVMDAVEDPEDPDTYYYCTQWDGLYKIKRNASTGVYEEVTHYYAGKNAPFVYGWGCSINGVGFDKFNNMWVLAGSTCSQVLYFLPAEARKKATTEISDWTAMSFSGMNLTFDSQILVCKNSNMIFVLDADFDTSLLAYDTKGTSTLDDDTYFVWDSYTDQDGKSVALNRAIAIAECPDGKVWIGAKEGVLEIANPTDATNSSMTFNHLKVPRNDGSGYADYLLDSEQINSIAVDGSNGKWIGTKTSGLYRVSAAGDQVLEHYTESNSYLPDDMVYAVAADPSSNDVFIATPNGVVKFVSMVAPSSQDLSSVYAYPNPVRPDYTGWIAIRGLMDNTRVKIADAAGNVLLDTVSEGGMVTWDGCNADGRRVRTGVYYVYASNTGEGISSQGAVTKILVVN